MPPDHSHIGTLFSTTKQDPLKLATKRPCRRLFMREFKHRPPPLTLVHCTNKLNKRINSNITRIIAGSFNEWQWIIHTHSDIGR